MIAGSQRLDLARLRVDPFQIGAALFRRDGNNVSAITRPERRRSRHAARRPLIATDPATDVEVVLRCEVARRLTVAQRYNPKVRLRVRSLRLPRLLAD